MESQSMKEPSASKTTNPFSESSTRLKESAILSGMGEVTGQGILGQGLDWAKNNPVESILGAVIIGGIGYQLYHYFTKKTEAMPLREESRKRSAFSKRRFRKRRFIEKAKELFLKENQQGEMVFDKDKTIQTVTVAATAVLAGTVMSGKLLPAAMLGATGATVLGVGIQNPLITLGAMGLAAGALIKELVRKTLHKEEQDKETISGTDNLVPDDSRLREYLVGQQIVDELNAEQEALHIRRAGEQKNKEELDRYLDELKTEELPELA